jgi:hypothetical protein
VLDVQLTEEPRQRVQALLSQPRIQSRVRFDACLDLSECGQSRLDARQVVLGTGTLVELLLSVAVVGLDLLLGERVRRVFADSPRDETSWRNCAAVPRPEIRSTWLSASRSAAAAAPPAADRCCAARLRRHQSPVRRVRLCARSYHRLARGLIASSALAACR